MIAYQIHKSNSCETIQINWIVICPFSIQNSDVIPTADLAIELDFIDIWFSNVFNRQIDQE